jgi:hypothetical protein
MKLSLMTLGAASSAVPLLMGAGAIGVPDGVPWWAALIASALGPAAIALVVGVGRAALMGLSGWFHARADAKRLLAADKLSDADPKNDDQARDLLVQAAGEDALGDAAEKAADALPTKVAK